jgi:hypothetical protein
VCGDWYCKRGGAYLNWAQSSILLNGFGCGVCW